MACCASLKRQLAIACEARAEHEALVQSIRENASQDLRSKEIELEKTLVELCSSAADLKDLTHACIQTVYARDTLDSKIQALETRLQLAEFCEQQLRAENARLGARIEDFKAASAASTVSEILNLLDRRR